MLYTQLLGNSNENVYLSEGLISYPDADFVHTLSTIFAPRIYGKDLSVFEVGSSSNIAFTINDTHVLNITRDDETETTYISHATPSESVCISTSNGYILYDTPTSNLVISSANLIRLAASNGVVVDGADYMRMVGDSLQIYSSNDSHFTTGCNMYFDSGSNVYINASCNIYMAAVQDILMTAANGAVVFHLDPPNSNMYFTASNNVTFSAMDGAMSFHQGHDSVWIDMRSNTLKLYADSNIDLTTSNITMTAHDRVKISACNGIDFGFVSMTDTEFAFNKFRAADGSYIQYVFVFNEADLNMVRRTYQDDVLIKNNLIVRYAVKD